MRRRAPAAHADPHTEARPASRLCGVALLPNDNIVLDDDNPQSQRVEPLLKLTFGVEPLQLSRHRAN